MPEAVDHFYGKELSKENFLSCCTILIISILNANAMRIEKVIQLCQTAVFANALWYSIE